MKLPDWVEEEALAAEARSEAEERGEVEPAPMYWSRAREVDGTPREPCQCPQGGPYDHDCRDHGRFVWRESGETWEQARAKSRQRWQVDQ